MFAIMKIFLTLLVPYAQKAIVVSKTLFSKNGIILVSPLVIAMPIFSTNTLMGIFLGMLMAGDFVTGVWVSWNNKKELEKTNPELKNQHLISSEGLKKSGVKFLLYSSTILMAWFLHKILMLNTFSFSFSKLNFTITLIVILFWITVEIYSIIFENAKKLGFDVVDKFNKIVDVFKKGKSKINE